MMSGRWSARCVSDGYSPPPAQRARSLERNGPSGVASSECARVRTAAQVKQDVWLKYQMRLLRERGVATVTVDYESLESLSTATSKAAAGGLAWLEAEERENFDAKDISLKRKSSGR